MINIYILERNGIPFYVGKAKNAVKRQHKHYLTFGTDIKMEVIDIVENEQWKFWEQYWICQFKSWGFKLENKNSGGGGPTEWTLKQKQDINPNRIEKIKNHLTRGENISKTLKQRNHSKYYTEDIKQKMSEATKNIPRPFSNEHIQNMGIAKRKQATPVLQYDLDSNFIKEWESKGQAAEWIKQQTGKTSNIVSQIKDCILGKQKTAFKYKWKYKTT
jgi:hypothetical protein